MEKLTLGGYFLVQLLNANAVLVFVSQSSWMGKDLNLRRRVRGL